MTVQYTDIELNIGINGNFIFFAINMDDSEPKWVNPDDI